MIVTVLMPEMSVPASNLMAMRILHTSDWHLGRTLRGVDLSDAHAAFLDHLVELARSEQADAVLVSGDVFDRALPPLDAVTMLDDALARLTEVAPVVVIPGNHDSAQRLGLNAKLLRDRLHIRATLDDIGTPVVVPDRSGHDGLVVYALPYLDPDMTRDRLGELVGTPADTRLARSHEAVVGAALSLVRRDQATRHDAAGRRTQDGRRLPTVVMAHAFVTGGEPSDSERDLRIGGVDSVPSSLFAGSGADYVALGHLHGAQAVAGSHDPSWQTGEAAVMRYAGSPLAFSFSEQHQHKSTAVVSFTDQGVVDSVDLIPAPVPRRLSDVRGSIDQVLGDAFRAQRDDWTRVVVTGDDRPADLTRTIKQAFPHALEVQFESSHRAQSPGADTSRRDDPLEVMSDFVDAVSKRAADADELKVLGSALEAALQHKEH